MPGLSYTEYKQFILRTLRRDGDTVLLADLDEYIAQAEAKLTRDMRIFRNTLTTTLQVTASSVSMPVGFRRVRAVSLEANNGDMLPLTLVSLPEMQDMQLANLADIVPYYAMLDYDTMLLAGNFAVSSPRALNLTYFEKVGSYASVNSQVLRDQGVYTDLYDAAVLSELPIPLMEDARLANMTAVYKSLLESANAERIENEYPWDTPLDSGVPYGVR